MMRAAGAAVGSGLRRARNPYFAGGEKRTV